MERDQVARAAQQEGTNAPQGHTATLDRLDVARANRTVLDLVRPGATLDQLVTFFGGRTTRRTVRAWLQGERFMAPWAIEMLRAHGATVLARADVLPRGPGKQAGWRNVKGYQLNMRTR